MREFASHLLTLSSLIIFISGISALRFERGRRYFSFTLTMVMVSIYCFGYSMELIAQTVTEARMWLNFQFIGISTFSSFWIIFILQLGGMTKYINKWTILILIIFTFSTTLTFYTFDSYYYFSSITYTPELTPIYSYNFGYYITITYYYIAGIISFLIVRKLEKEQKLERNIALIFHFGNLFPFFAFSLNVFGLITDKIDLVPFGFMFTGILYNIGVFRYKFFDITPVAFNKIFENAQIGAIILDNDLRIANINNSAKQMLFPNTKVEQGYKLSVIDYPEISLIEKIKNKNDNFIYKYNYQRTDYYYNITINDTSSKKGKIIGKTILIYDITEQKEKEERLRELNETKDKFFSIIAHDLKNPIGAFKMSMSIIQNNFGTFSYNELKDIIVAAQDSADSLFNLLENLLTWSRSQRGKIDYNPDVVNLSSIFNNLKFLFAEHLKNKQISYVSNIPYEVTAYVDANLIATIFRNLISNSIKFTPENGKIVIFEFPTSEEGYIGIAIKDSGVGMTQDQIEKLFSVGNTKSSTNGTLGETGTGLGLILCKEFAEMNKAKIWAESEKGNGSIFKVLLPKDPI